MRTLKLLLSLALAGLAVFAFAVPAFAEAGTSESHWTEGLHPLEHEGIIHLSGTLQYANALENTKCSIEADVTLWPGGDGRVDDTKLPASSCSRTGKLKACGAVSAVDVEGMQSTSANAIESAGSQLMEIPLGITVHLEQKDGAHCLAEMYASGNLELKPNVAGGISSFSFAQENINTDYKNESETGEEKVTTIWIGSMALAPTGQYGIATGRFGLHWTRNGATLEGELDPVMTGSIKISGSAGYVSCPIEIVPLLDGRGEGRLWVA